MLKEIMDVITLVIGIVGVAVILWGVAITLVSLVGLELKRLQGVNICKKREHIRHHLGSYLLLGLELLVAADVAHTIVDPELSSLIVLGSIVAIRTVISYFLNKELSSSHNCSEDELEASANSLKKSEST